jgi:hypothetical protein
MIERGAKCPQPLFPQSFIVVVGGFHRVMQHDLVLL